MELLELNIEDLSYKNIKGKIDLIEINKEYNKKEYEELSNKLLQDKRKNVKALGNKLLKEKKKLVDEINRVKAMYSFDRAFSKGYVAGVDEVGRGPLAGPIVACAVVLDLDSLEEDLILGLNDSKKLSEKKREELAEIIKEKAISYYIASCSNEEIDRDGIAYCNNKVFLDSCTSLGVTPELVLSDGYLVKHLKIRNEFVIKGDTKSASIAAASIVAKVYRDKLMKEYGKEYPNYAFEENAGYGTGKHIEALKTYGPCKIHRKSFITRII